MTAKAAETETAVPPCKPLTPEAIRALDEAAGRRICAGQAQAKREINGRGGLEPARYGDWEIKGLASDF